jgi:hypothetical protein
MRLFFVFSKTFINPLRKYFLSDTVRPMMNYAKQKTKWADRRAAMRKMLDAGATKADVARKYGVRPQRINQLFPRGK